MSEYLWEEQKEYPELNPLRTGSIAEEFEVYLNKSKVAAGRNPDLERELKQILEADQWPRLLMDTVGRHYGFNSHTGEARVGRNAPGRFHEPAKSGADSANVWLSGLTAGGQ